MIKSLWCIVGIHDYEYIRDIIMPTINEVGIEVTNKLNAPIYKSDIPNGYKHRGLCIKVCVNCGKIVDEAEELKKELIVKIKERREIKENHKKRQKIAKKYLRRKNECG